MMILQLKYHPNGIADEPHTILTPKGAGKPHTECGIKKHDWESLLWSYFPLPLLAQTAAASPSDVAVSSLLTLAHMVR